MKKTLLFLTVLFGCSSLFAQQLVTMVVDLSVGARHTHFGSFVAYNGKLVFEADTASKYPTPSQLWITDGTATGTKVLKYFLHNKEPRGFNVINDKLHFTAGDSLNGSELWETDGTALGTRIVRDIFPGPNDGLKGIPVLANNKLYFTADDGIHGTEIWVSDGTSVGTKVFTDLNKTTSANFSPNSLVVADGTLFFLVSTNSHTNQLWAIDLDGQNLRQILSGSYVDGLFSFGKNVMFNVRQDYGGGYPYFSVQAYNTQSKSVTVLKNGIFHRNDFVTLRKKACFLAEEFTGGTGPQSIWETDGTVNGTKQIVERVLINCYSSIPSIGLTAHNGKLYFTASDSSGFDRLWTIENTPPLMRSIKRFSSTHGFPGYAKHLMNVNGYMYFKAWDDSSSRINLWRSDGTSEGTAKVKVDAAEASNTFNTCAFLSGPMMLVDSTLYFTNAYDSANTGFELYRVIATHPPVDTIKDSTNNNSHVHWKAHPNPTSDYLHFDFTFDADKNYTATLSCIDGRVCKRLDNSVIHAAGTSSFSIDVRDLRKGIYILRFTDETRSITEKISIER